MKKEDENFLIEFLSNNIPALYLGAGFSYGAKRTDGKKICLGQEFKREMVEYFFNDDEDLKKELESKSPEDVCEIVKQSNTSLYNRYITASFSGFMPEPFHDYLLDYKWLDIYSVNVDDIVEQVFIRNKKQLTVIKQKRNTDSTPENGSKLFKLHGSISYENEGYTFSSSEYNELANDTTDYRLLKFIVALHESPLLVIGTELNERDLDSLEYLYRRANKEFFSKQVIFINPKPTAYFRRKMKNYPKWKLIEITAEDFLTFIHNNKDKMFSNYYSRLQLIKRNGCLSLDLIKKNLVEINDYLSMFYFGYTATWEDAIYGYIVGYKVLIDTIDIIKKNQHRIYALYGRIYSGKSAAIKYLFISLMQIPDCICLFIDNEELSIGNIAKIVKSLTEARVYLFIDDAADYYSLFDRIYYIDPRISIISISRYSLHTKKRYVMDHSQAFECDINQFLSDDIQLVRDKLIQKGLSGSLTGKPLNEWEEKIGRSQNITAAIYKVTENEEFSGYYKRLFRKNDLRNRQYYSVLLAAAILYKADVSYLSKILLYKLSVKLNDEIMDECKEYLQIFAGERLRIVSPAISDAVLEEATQSDILNLIISLTTSISGLVSEREKNYWKTTYEYLTKYKILKRIFKFTNKEIRELYTRIFDSYQNRSYYWLQRGLLEQNDHKFELANNHFDSALAIHNESYAILHAKARNYCKQAIHIGEQNKGIHFFGEGRKIFFSLIENYEYKQSKAYSIHSLIFESMEYYKQYSIGIDKRTEKEFMKLIDEALSKDPYDSLLQELKRRFILFLKNSSDFDLYGKYEDNIDE